jgi:hypothetical protein
VLSAAADGVRARDAAVVPVQDLPEPLHLVTGLRPDRNGIVENNMEDPAIPGRHLQAVERAAVQDRRWWTRASRSG